MVERTRATSVHLKLTPEEHAELRAVQAILGLPVHALLTIGVKYAQRQWDRETARHLGPRQEGPHSE